MGCNCGGSQRAQVQPAVRDARVSAQPPTPKRQQRAATAPLEPGWVWSGPQTSQQKNA